MHLRLSPDKKIELFYGLDPNQIKPPKRIPGVSKREQLAIYKSILLERIQKKYNPRHQIIDEHLSKNSKTEAIINACGSTVKKEIKAVQQILRRFTCKGEQEIDIKNQKVSLVIKYFLNEKSNIRNLNDLKEADYRGIIRTILIENFELPSVKEGDKEVFFSSIFGKRVIKESYSFTDDELNNIYSPWVRSWVPCREDLHYLPITITRLTHTNKLYLRHNKLNALTLMLTTMRHLICIDLRYNKLSALPYGIGRLHNLKKLYLQNNRIEFLPGDFCQLEKLEILDLSDNKLVKLPNNFGKLANLSELNISGNPIMFIPHSIVKLINLRKIFMLPGLGI